MCRPLSLRKCEKLCSLKDIERLFGRNIPDTYSHLAYPLRAVWSARTIPQDNQADLPSRFLISVPKKRLRHAVDRVKMRRRIREAYRLNRTPQSAGADIAFIYVGSSTEPYDTVERAMVKLLARIATTLHPCG